MAKYDIIMFNMSSYGEWKKGVSNRNFHILRELEMREEVGKILTVDYLPINWRRAVKNYRDNIVADIEGAKVIKRRPWCKLTQVSEKIYVYSDIRFFIWPGLVMHDIKQLAIKLNFGEYLAWSFFPFIAPFWHNLGQKLSVFDAVDNWLLHSAYRKQQTRLKKCYEQLKNETDIIFVVSQNLLNFFDDQPNVYWLANGVDVKHYGKKFALVNRDIADIPRPIIGYIGVIQDKVDFDLIEYLAQKNADKSFVMVGPVWNEKEQARAKLSACKNIYWLGYKSYSEAPMYIQQFDIGIIPHRRSGFSASTNPMKAYEYLACGKPVVAASDIGIDNLDGQIKIAKTYPEFDELITQSLREDNEEFASSRKEEIKKFSWHNTVSKMLELVNNKWH